LGFSQAGIADKGFGIIVFKLSDKKAARLLNKFFPNW